MHDLELISHPLCPYVQRVAIVLQEKGLAYVRRYIDLADKPDWFLALSPLAKVPLLRTPSGVLFESAAIVEYLDDSFGSRLHPADPFLRAQHRAWMEFASNLLSELAQFYNALDAAAFAQRADALRTRFARLEDQLSGGPFFNGVAFSLVDVVFAPVFRYWQVLDALPEARLLRGLPRLAAWRTALAERPSVRAAAPADYPQRLRAFLAGRDSHLGRLYGKPPASP
ncbi:MAG: glutathione S-transferase family protein [Pseudomonas sp.]|uniref:glutathione S-transferase family protein n=1 Tax=Pseudomonas sp. TaxID=306 RepID=UPI003399B590